jgi:hypothetical protein
VVAVVGVKGKREGEREEGKRLGVQEIIGFGFGVKF